MRYSIYSSVLLACTGLTLAACAPDKGPGSLTVDYVLGNNKTCDEVNVDRLRATLYQGAVDDPSVELDEDVDCDSSSMIEFSELEPGVYNLLVTAYDADGVATFDNLGQPEAERRHEIFEAAEATAEAELTARPAQLEVAWRLGEGGFANCGGVGIDAFEIVAYQTGGGTVLLETELDCELTGGSNGYREVEDPDRDLNGTLFGEVGIQALAADGSSVGDPAVFVFDPPGPGYTVQLNIECTDTGCYEQE